MRKIEDYRKHAEECRAMMARSRSDKDREMLQDMAETWDSLASARQEQMARKARIVALDEYGLPGIPHSRPEL